MILSFGNSSRTIELKSYKPNFQSGIEWVCVGGVWQGIDRGTNTDHYSTTLTIHGLLGHVQNIRDFVLEGLKLNRSASVECDESEKIFGCEFDYSTLINYCKIDANQTVFVSEAPNGSVLGEWSFSLIPTIDLKTRFRALPDEFPNIPAISSERDFAINGTTSRNEVGWSSIGFRNDAPLVTIGYRSSSDNIGQMKKWLSLKRKVPFPLISPAGIYYFADGVQSNNVYFSSMVDFGNLDIWSHRAQLSVTFLLAR
jgi:hypothetical protein